MPLNNRARQQLRNFYAKVQATKKAKGMTVSVTRATNNKSNNKLSPKTVTTRTGRKVKVFPKEVRAPSGRIYSIQTIRSNSRLPSSIR
jgi:predicted secreted protein